MQIRYPKSLLCLVLLLISFSFQVQSQDNVISYKLPNGFTVCLNEDHSSQYVTGALVCKIADNMMPKGKEALAHMIEHMLFKGTDKLGTNNWEKEKPLYDTIVNLYKKLDAASGEKTRNAIKKRISEVSDSESRYIIHGEFYTLQENIGNGEGFTYNKDYTVYHTSFLPDKLEKWIDLNAQRFSHPVFREFMKEQSVISQEYFERSQDKSVPRWDYIYKAIYGKPANEQLSENVFNLSLSDVINVYQKYYVPENMALVISGNFSPQAIKPVIDKCFSGIPSHKSTVQALPSSGNFMKKQIQHAYYDDQRSVTLLFKGAPHLSKDYYSYRIAMNMLANGFNGLQDSIWHNGLVESCRSNWNWGKDGCLYYIYVNPFENQTLKNAKDLVLKQVQKIANGKFTDQTLIAAKKTIDREIDLEKENLFLKVSNIAQHFVYGMEIPDKVYRKSLFDAVTREDVMRAVKKYLLGNYAELYPFPEKENIAVVKNIEYPKRFSFGKNYKSEYAHHFDSIPDFRIKLLPFGFGDVFDTTLVKQVRYYSILNRVDKSFHLKLIFKPSKEVNTVLNRINADRRFEYLCPDGKGTWEFRQDLAKNGCTYDFDQSNGSVILNIYGMDETLADVMQLFSPLLTNADVNHDGMMKIQGIYAAAPKHGEKVFPVLPDSLRTIYRQMFSSLSEVSYYGSMQAKNALAAVSPRLGLKEKEIPVMQNMVNQYASNRPEIKLWMYSGASSPKYRMQLMVLKYYVFRILWDEIRVANGLAYILGTDVKIPDNEGSSGYLYASVRTKDYQIPMASALLTSILKNLPESEMDFESALQETRNELLNKVLNPKIAFDYIKDSKNKGLTSNSETEDLEALERLSLPDLLLFYRNQFGQANIRMDIYGNMSEIGKANFDRLKKELELRASL